MITSQAKFLLTVWAKNLIYGAWYGYSFME